MQDNPYSAIIGIMREEGSVHNPPSIMLAEVIAPPPDLLIKIGDIQIGKPNILIADYLLADYQRKYSQTGKGTIISKTPPAPEKYSEYTVLESLDDSGQITWTDTLKSGDTITVMPTCDGQTYIILARVVRI